MDALLRDSKRFRQVRHRLTISVAISNLLVALAFAGSFVGLGCFWGCLLVIKQLEDALSGILKAVYGDAPYGA